jgi:hypothetical protein
MWADPQPHSMADPTLHQLRWVQDLPQAHQDLAIHSYSPCGHTPPSPAGHTQEQVTPILYSQDHDAVKRYSSTTSALRCTAAGDALLLHEVCKGA